MSDNDTVKELREEIAKLRERIAVIEERTIHHPPVFRPVQPPQENPWETPPVPFPWTVTSQQPEQSHPWRTTDDLFPYRKRSTPARVPSNFSTSEAP